MVLLLLVLLWLWLWLFLESLSAASALGRERRVDSAAAGDGGSREE